MAAIKDAARAAELIESEPCGAHALDNPELPILTACSLSFSNSRQQDLRACY